MIKTIKELKEIYQLYDDIQGKIRREVIEGKIHPIMRGLYETNQNTPGYLLANSIYGPSYLSFEFALAFHQLIPEKVTLFTSASYQKRKTKIYQTPFGNFSYRDIPKAAFSYGVETIKTEGCLFKIASKEKALCDMLCQLKPLMSVGQIPRLLFEDLRIDEDDFNHLSQQKLKKLIPLYKRKNLTLLGQYLSRGNQHGHS